MIITSSASVSSRNRRGRTTRTMALSRFVLVASVATAASLNVVPHRSSAQRYHSSIRSAIKMADQDKSPLAVLSAVPWNTLLLGFVTLDCANRLTSKVPEIVSGSSSDYFGTVLDVVFVGYGVTELLKKAGVGKTD